MVDPLIEHQLPRGGPIYLPDLVGPLTRVPEFEALVFKELQDLIAESNMDYSSSQIFQIHDDDDDDDDISVEELKIFSEEELVDKALKEAFQVENLKEKSSLVQEELSDQGLNGKDKLEKIPKKRNKRGRICDRNMRASELENTSYIEKVEQLTKIKQKQDEDKISATLHSFNGGCKVNEGPITSSDNIERMTSFRYITSAGKARKPATASIPHGEAVSYPEVVLCVEIHKMGKNWVKMQELLVLGSQMLSELRDQICCLTDLLMQKAAQHDPSGYFLIEDVFCNDKRDPIAVDYSEPIFDWLRESDDETRKKWEYILSGELQQKHGALLGRTMTPNLPHFKAVEMHKIRFCDLGLRLGAGYLYCHQGDCKHIVVIRDMRLIHPEDVQNREAYPILTFQHKSRHHKCSACKIYHATKVTVDDKWSQENPCYFCDNCYYLLHYGKDGTLLYHEFTVYDYFHE